MAVPVNSLLTDVSLRAITEMRKEQTGVLPFHVILWEIYRSKRENEERR